MVTSPAYDRLEAQFRQISRLNDARSILSWDEAVMMPSGSGEDRGSTIAELGGLTQNLLKNPALGEWLDEAEARETEPWRLANVREMRRQYVDATAVPVELNQRLTRASFACEQRWREARAKNDWATFRPYLEEVLSLTRESLAILASVKRLSLYDTALSLYSPGLNVSVVESLFAELKSFLPDLTREIVSRQKTPRPLEGQFPKAAQRALGVEVMTALGFNFERGRLDESHHPFCGGTPGDLRLTTRYDETDFLSSLMGAVHETGHALYEQNLPLAWRTQPVGGAAGMAIHESQSLFIEMQVGRSAEFTQFLAPKVRAHLATHVRDVAALDDENLRQLVTRVEPGFIRVDSDEVTYPAHVILRFELERALIEGNLKLADLPVAWDEKMRAYLGLSTLGNDRDGCMQDVHWPAGLFGYFPAYTFGAVIAAQLFARMREEQPEISSEIARGDFASVRGWLSDKIWSQGARFGTLELVERAAGPLSTKAFRAHLETRYLL